MRARRLSAFLLGGLLAAAGAPAADVRSTLTVLVDGAAVDGVLGYRIEFNRQPLTLTDTRRLGLAYSPDQRRLILTVTQRGLNRLQDWLNSATDTQAPTGKAVTVIAKDESDTVLARWELANVVPTTVSSAAAGAVAEVDTTIEFLYDRLRLAEASSK
jgi:hypothetical protein